MKWPRSRLHRVLWLAVAVVVAVVVAVAVVSLPRSSHSQQPPDSQGPSASPGPSDSQQGSAPNFSVPYAGTDYYAPTFANCPFYSSWTAPCYDRTRQEIDSDMAFLSDNGGGKFQRIWISLDQLFSCFDKTTGFCGYDDQAVGNVLDTLRLLAGHQQVADLVLFAQPNRNSDVNYFHAEALDGDHDEMRANYIKAAAEFVQRIAADPVASSAVAVIDMQNEGYFQNRNALRDLGSSCGDDGDCIDNELSKPFFTELYDKLKGVAPQFFYTLSGVRGELLGSNMSYWISMYPVDVYDVHLYLTDPQDHTSSFSRAKDLPKPWFAGEAGTSNTDNQGKDCYTYDGNDPCTVQTATWWREHLGPDYGAKAVLIEHGGAVLTYDEGAPAFTKTGEALARLM
jgi:hypothetical protein